MTDPTPSKTVVPFGKHKGKDIIEVIESDPAYLSWLTAQEWFRNKFVTLHQTIINRGSETEETPDHNALQVLFLDDAFCRRFCQVIGGEDAARELLKQSRERREKEDSKSIEETKNKLESATEQLASHIASEHTKKEELEHRRKELDQKHKEQLEQDRERERKELEREYRDRIRKGRDWQSDARIDTLERNLKKDWTKYSCDLVSVTERLATYEQDFASTSQELQKTCDEATAKLPWLTKRHAVVSANPVTKIKWSFHREFEQGGVDVRLTADAANDSLPASLMDEIKIRPQNSRIDYYLIEIKPVVGDDYPAILRQMRRNGSKVLFTKGYAGVGATREQFLKTFETAGLRVVFLDQCEEM